MAVLLNPPSASSGSRSRNAVARAASVLGYHDAVLANLCTVATPSVVQLNGLDREAWDESKADLELAIRSGSALLAGWGVAGVTGDARRWMRAQIAWLIDCAHNVAIESMWMVGGEPRHPSRWHQYVSDKYGRTSGGSFDERIAQVLVEVPLVAYRRSIQVSPSRWSHAEPSDDFVAGL